jgi:hypothetical protein
MFFVGSIEPGQGRLRHIGKTVFQGRPMPDLARLYDLHAEDCARTAEKVDNPNHRAMLLKAAEEWRQAAQARRQSMQHSEEQSSGQKQAQQPASHAKKVGKGQRGISRAT